MRLLLIEDNERLATLLADYLDVLGYRIDTAHNLAMADDLWAVSTYQLVILDLGLPDGTGFSFLEKLRSANHPTLVLILTAQDSVDSRIEGLDLGADDYLVKPFHNAELAARLRALLRRPEIFLGDSLECGNLLLNLNERKVMIGDKAVSLSRRELELLEILLRRSGHIVTKETLIENVHEHDNTLSDNALEVSIHRLRKKIQADDSACSIKTVRGIGYILDEARP